MQVLLLFIIMAHVVVSPEELREAYGKKESTLGRLLETWEKQIMEAQIYHEKMKAVPKEERANINGFSKMLTSAYNKFAVLKRRPDFNEEIWDFPRIDFGDPPPRNSTKLFTGLLQPTFKEGTGSFVSGGPYGPGGPPLKM